VLLLQISSKTSQKTEEIVTSSVQEMICKARNWGLDDAEFLVTSSVQEMICLPLFGVF